MQIINYVVVCLAKPKFAQNAPNNVQITLALQLAIWKLVSYQQAFPQAKRNV